MKSKSETNMQMCDQCKNNKCLRNADLAGSESLFALCMLSIVHSFFSVDGQKALECGNPNSKIMKSSKNRKLTFHLFRRFYYTGCTGFS